MNFLFKIEAQYNINKKSKLFSIEQYLKEMNHMIKPSPTYLSQEAQNIRLQRLIQQRKRMQYLSFVITSQKSTIDSLTLQNQDINTRLCEIELQNKILQDKLSTFNSQCDYLNDIIIKQSSLIETLKYQLNENANKEVSIDQLDINRLRSNNQEKQMHFSFNSRIKGNLILPSNNELQQQYMILNQKYQNLCTDYCQLMKKQKISEYKLLMSQKSHKNHNKNYSSEAVLTYNSNKQYQPSNTQSQLYQKINHLQAQILKREYLIQKHRQNESQQAKLVLYLKQQFKAQGKNISSIIKSKKTKDQACQTSAYVVNKTITNGKTTQPNNIQNKEMLGVHQAQEIIKEWNFKQANGKKVGSSNYKALNKTISKHQKATFVQ